MKIKTLPLLFLLPGAMAAFPALAQTPDPAPQPAVWQPAGNRRLPRTVPLLTTPPPARRWLIDVSGATDLTNPAVFNPRFAQASVAGWHLWRLGTSGKYWLGAGPRLTRCWFEGATFVRQPAHPQQGQLRLESAQLTTVNLAVHAQVRLTHWLQFGGSIDLTGGTWGPTIRHFTQISPIPELDPAAVDVCPQRGNLLLGGKADRGTLTSEVYAGLRLTRHTSARFGLHYTGTNYVIDGRRYQHFATLGSLGLTYSFSE